MIGKVRIKFKIEVIDNACLVARAALPNVDLMSAFGGKADIAIALRNVRF
jgi:hypothetical protein